MKLTISKQRRQTLALLTALAIGGGIIFVMMASALIVCSTKGRVFEDLAELPNNEVGLVLGARRGTLFYQNRIHAAAALYKARKVKHLLVSGDNHVVTYDEPTDMKTDLIGLGVPADDITCDYAGFRTLDSVVRARHIFGQQRLTIISQRFHNYRALFIADRQRIKAVAFNAEDVPEPYQGYTERREILARTLTVLDLYVLWRKPRFLGPFEPIAVGNSKSCPCSQRHTDS